MKTIEEAIDDYLYSIKSGGRVPDFEQDNFNAGNLYGFKNGFKAGVEFAQHWTSVKDGQPPPKKRVLVKYREYQIESVSVGLLTSMDRWVVSGCTDFANVSHWRLIENR